MITIVPQWREVVAMTQVRYPDPARVVHVDVEDNGILRVWLVDQRCNVDGHSMPGFCVSNTQLTIWPGTFLAQAWIAAAWAGYIQHEALELVYTRETGKRPLDPHAEPYDSNPWNRGLRDGFAPVLTWATLETGLGVVMSILAARALIANHRDT